MKVVIRADASTVIGSGHIMRCLTLAGALRATGASIRFISRNLPDHLTRLVATESHDLVQLTGAVDDEVQDAEQTLAAAGELDWMIVDHYGLGTRWEAMVRRGSRIMVIDDLARPHDCDLLLDQNHHPDAEARYAGLVPAGCRVLAGPRFALLRPEFAALRHGVAPRDGAVRRLLVFLGGMDADNVTGAVLDAIDQVDHDGVAIDVVIGASHLQRDELSARCAELPGVTCHIQTSNMAALLANTDLAVGAGGSATWERSALGVPTLALCLADNQRELLHHAGRAGIVYVPDIASTDSKEIAVHLQALLGNSGLRHLLSRRGYELVDGHGARRVALALLFAGITMRRANRADSANLHAWRNSPAIRAVSNDTAEIPLASHERWLEGIVVSDASLLLIGEHDSVPIGVVRFDIIDTNAVVSIYLVPEQIGRGHGEALLAAAEHWLRTEQPQIRTLDAQVRAENLASQRLFERSGYFPRLTHYCKDL